MKHIQVKPIVNFSIKLFEVLSFFKSSPVPAGGYPKISSSMAHWGKSNFQELLFKTTQRNKLAQMTNFTAEKCYKKIQSV